MKSGMIFKCAFLVFLLVAFGGSDIFAQNELLKSSQNGIYVSGGFDRLNDNELTLFTETISLLVRGRVEFGAKYTQVYQGAHFNETFGSLQIIKPSSGFPFGAGASMSLVKGGRVGYFGGSINWRTEAPGRDQFVAKITVGATRTRFGVPKEGARLAESAKRNDVDNALTLGVSLIASNRLTNGLQLTISPQYTWQRHIGSVVGLQIGILRLDPDPVIN